MSNETSVKPAVVVPGTMERLLSKIPWGKLRPRVPKLKKLFGPFLLVSVILLFIGYAFILDQIQPQSRGEKTTFDEILNAASEGRVQEAVFLEFDSRVLFKATPKTVEPAQPAPAAQPAPGGQPGAAPAPQVAPPPPPPAKWYWSSVPTNGAVSEEMIGRVVRSGATFEPVPQRGKSTLKFIATTLYPLLILVTLFALFFLIITGQGGASDFLGFSKFASKVQRRKKGHGLITFKDVAAIDEGITELQEVVDYLMNPEQFAEIGAQAPKGILLAGPPGTGKTLLAKAVAGEANVPFIQLSGSEFVESLVGVGAARVRDLFKQARELAPCIIFIDELDAAGRQRGAGVGQGNDEREQTLNQLLVEMDGFTTSLGIAVLGATNRPDILDPALLRPGRFDRQVVIDVPDARGRFEILQVHARKRPLDENVDLMQIAKQVPGFTGAELANILNEAALLAVRRKRHEILQIDLEEAVDRVLAGPERRSHILTEEEKRLIAYHEAGHAVVARGAGQETGVLKLSIVARGLQLGHASTFSSADRLIMLRSEMEGQITTLLGGLAAEMMIFGELSTGNTADLEKATNMARKMVATYGMTDHVGRMQVLHEGAVFMGRDFAAAQHTSTDILNMVDAEIRKILDSAEQHALQICRANRQVMEEIVKRLLEDETLNGPELEPMLARVKKIVIPRPMPEIATTPGNGAPTPSRRRRPSGAGRG